MNSLADFPSKKRAIITIIPMPWQDVLITVGTVFLIIALLPSVFGKNKPALATSLMTGTILGAFAFAYSTLELWFASGTTFISALIWFTLSIQVWSREKKK